jgi:hypothetical protein
MAEKQRNTFLAIAMEGKAKNICRQVILLWTCHYSVPLRYTNNLDNKSHFTPIFAFENK